ncbi:Nudix hydrolase domain-containing protein [Aphelenchoides besseyi]|nr:Nudix hydrolase domain-containing protein [Aphelenchoides besseyi]
MSQPPFSTTPISAFRPEDVISCEQLENSVSGILDSPMCETPTSSKRIRKPIARPAKKDEPVRVCFQLEQAHWYYVDYYCEGNHCEEPCPNLGFRDFVKKVVGHSHSLLKYKNNVDDIVDQFRQYKSLIPTYGAVMFDPSLTQILLVQGYFASRNSWGFPKGKVNEDEDPKACAIREVLEETGYDISQKLADDVIFRYAMNDTMVHLYVAVDVDRNFNFHPHLRKEIRKIAWFDIADLPRHRSDFATCNRQGQGCRPNNFYGVVPAVDFIQKFSAEQLKLRKRSGHHKVSAFEPVIPRGANASASSSGVFPFVGYAETSGFHPHATPASSNDLFASLRLNSPTDPMSKKYSGDELLKSLMSTTTNRPNSLYTTAGISASAQEIGVIGEQRENRQVIKHPIAIQPNHIIKPNSLGRMSFNHTPSSSFANVTLANMSSVSLQTHFRSFSDDKTSATHVHEDDYTGSEDTIDCSTPPLLPADLLASSPATNVLASVQMNAQAHLEVCRRGLNDGTQHAKDRRRANRASKRSTKQNTPAQELLDASVASNFFVGSKSPASTSGSDRPSVSDVLSNIFSAARNTGGVIQVEDLETQKKPNTPMFYVAALEDNLDEKTTTATSETTIDKYARSEITGSTDSIHNYFSVGEDAQSSNSDYNSAPTYDIPAPIETAMSSGGNTSDDEATPLHSAQQQHNSHIIRLRPLELCRAWRDFRFDLSKTNLSSLLG